jgi:hypothetical protein
LQNVNETAKNGLTNQLLLAKKSRLEPVLAMIGNAIWSASINEKETV